MQGVYGDRSKLPGRQPYSVRGRTFIHAYLPGQDHQAYCPVSILQAVYQ